jgi:hypothetical protein
MDIITTNQTFHLIQFQAAQMEVFYQTVVRTEDVANTVAQTGQITQIVVQITAEDLTAVQTELIIPIVVRTVEAENTAVLMEPTIQTVSCNFYNINY